MMVENSAKWALEFLNGPLQGQTRQLYDGFVIGRHSDCDLQIKEGYLSRRHARIICNARDLYIEDLNSANGTFVNDIQITLQAIYPGDRIKLDLISMQIFELDSSSDPTVALTGRRSAVETDRSDQGYSNSEPATTQSPETVGPEGTLFLDSNVVPESDRYFVVDASLLQNVPGSALIGITPPYRNRIFELRSCKSDSRNSDSGKYTIGYSSNNDIAINDDTVSTTHAQLIEADGGWKLENLLAANGTYVNNTKIQTAYLSNGDRVRFGATSFHFYAATKKRANKPGKNRQKRPLRIFVATFTVVALFIAAVVYWYYDNY